jgi:hypothetical protein
MNDNSWPRSEGKPYESGDQPFPASQFAAPWLEPIPVPECREAAFHRELQAAYHTDTVLGALRESFVELISRSTITWLLDTSEIPAGGPIKGEGHYSPDVQAKIDAIQKQMSDRRLQIFDDVAQRMGMNHD